MRKGWMSAFLLFAAILTAVVFLAAPSPAQQKSLKAGEDARGPWWMKETAMSRDGLFPAALASLHPRTKAPARATAVMASIASLFVLSGSFPQVVALFLCPTLAFIALAAAGLLRVRRSEPGGSAFRCPGSPATPLLFVVFVLGVILLVALARPLPALLGFALVLAGLPFYRIVAERGAAAATKNSDKGSQ